MGVKGKRPNLFKKGEGRRRGRRAIDDMRAEVLDRLQATAQRVDNVTVKRMPNYLQITESKLEQQGVIDLKKAFARSSKKRISKDGGWYLIVPIRIKTSRMSKKTYQDMRSLEVPEGGIASTLTDYLVGRRKEVTHPSMQPPEMTHNMSKLKTGRNASYFIFRTVSSKSPASSWILNRDKVNSNNFSKTTLQNVKRLMDWKMKNLK